MEKPPVSRGLSGGSAMGLPWRLVEQSAPHTHVPLGLWPKVVQHPGLAILIHGRVLITDQDSDARVFVHWLTSESEWTGG
jgi:hypothetical protein